MAAELNLIALPDTPAWRQRWREYVDAEWIVDPSADLDVPGAMSSQTSDALWDDLRDMPTLWVGDVSWAKAGSSGDIDRYVPGPVLRIHDLIGAGRVLTAGLGRELTVAMNLPNRSIYGTTQYYWTTNAEHLALVAEANARGERRTYGQLVAPHLIRSRGEGLNSGRAVKRWVAQHVGAFVITTSV